MAVRNTIRNVIGPKVRKQRIDQELSQTELAARCQRFGWDISRDVIASIEDQTRKVCDIELVYLADALKTSLESLSPDRKAALKLL